MSDQQKPSPHEERQAVRRKVEEVSGIIQPTMDALRELGYQPTLSANQESGVISMTLDVYVIPKS